MINKTLISFLIAVLFASSSFAEDIYIANSAAGDNTGASCAHAYPLSWANTGGNWGVGADKISAGDTLHLCGTITGDNNATGLTVGGSGTGGSPISIVAETDAILTSVGWGSAIYCSGKDYLVIDGGTNGIIRNTANGTSLDEQNNSVGVNLTNCDNVTVRNWTISDLFIHLQNENEPSHAGGTGIRSYTSSSVVIDNNTIDNVASPILVTYDENGQSSVTIQNNTLSFFNIGVRVADLRADSTIDNVSIVNNSMHDAANWDENWEVPPASEVNPYFHHNGVHVYSASAGSTITNLSIYRNYMYGDFGTAKCTANIFVEPSPGTITGLNIYSNVVANDNGTYCSNGTIYVKSGATPYIYSNTMVSGGSGMGIRIDGDGVLRNNILYDYDVCVQTGATVITSNYNDFYSCSRPFTVNNSTTSWAAWQALGYDANSITSDPLFVSVSDFSLQAGSPAINAGATLGSPYNVDYLGVVRPQGLLYDAGAYEFDAGIADDPRTSTPSSMAGSWR